MDKRDEWLGPVGSGDLNVLLCRTALVFYQDKNLLEEEKGGGGMEAVKTQVASVIFGFLNRLITLFLFCTFK